MTAIIPKRLVMMPYACFYCGKSEEGSLKETRIEWLFGIRHCEDHLADAKRDCNSYCHRLRIVPMHDAKNSPVLANLLHIMDTFEFTIMRSDGTYESGWKPDYGTILDQMHIEKIDHWIMPLKNDQGECKFVMIEDLAKKEKTGSPILVQPALDAIKALDAGIYKKDYDRLSLAKVDS